MKFFAMFTSGLILSVTSVAALAEAQLDVRITPANSELKANIEGYVGSPGERDSESLKHFSIGAEEQARRAAQALGYYQATISSEVQPGRDSQPKLVIKSQPGDPIRLREVTVRIEG